MPSTNATPIAPRITFRRRSRCRLARPYAVSFSSAPGLSSPGASVELSDEVRASIPAASQRLQAQVEYIGKRLKLRAELAALQHGGPDEIPPLLRLRLGQAGRGVLAPLRGRYNFALLPAPFRDQRRHLGRRARIGLVGVEDRAHETLRHIGLLLEIVPPRTHECGRRRIRAHVATCRLQEQV